MADPSEGPGTDEPGVIIITIAAQAGNQDPVTSATTLHFVATLEDSSEPTLDLSFYEVVTSSSSPNSLEYLPITVTNPPVVSWSNGIGSFALTMNSSIFNQLTSSHTNFAVKAQIADNSNSLGMYTMSISLVTSPTDS